VHELVFNMCVSDIVKESNFNSYPWKFLH
jgi:hypothetical protein